ncbi:MAG: DUF1499 domain-containing protein [Deltaproteobacteria bacterium]
MSAENPSFVWSLLLVLPALALFSCAGTQPVGLGVHDGRLRPCPASPNCVCSEDGDQGHAIAPLHFTGDPQAAFARAKAAALTLPGTKLAGETKDFLHFESTSALMGFVDDLELQLVPGKDEIAVRSASRLGYGDMGVNRKRVEALRAAFAAAA